MATPRKFKTVDYEESLQQTVTIEECLPEDHLARFVVMVIMQLDLKHIYEQYGALGAPPYAPEIMLGLLFYGYATGVFSSRKIEKATYETIPFRFIAGGLHPDTIADFRKTFLSEIQELFVQILVLAQIMGVFKLGNISLDGSKVHADASKSKAVSYKRLLKLETQLRQEVEELLALSEQADQIELPEEFDVGDELAFRKNRLANLAEAKAVLEARAKERYEAEKAEYEAKMNDREEKARQTGQKPRGRTPQPPVPGARDKDQYNFTDPESRIMKNSNNSGFDQHYNVQVAVEQESLLIIGLRGRDAPCRSNACGLLAENRCVLGANGGLCLGIRSGVLPANASSGDTACVRLAVGRLCSAQAVRPVASGVRGLFFNPQPSPACAADTLTGFCLC